jgi:hypothetical protein
VSVRARLKRTSCPDCTSGEYRAICGKDGLEELGIVHHTPDEPGHYLDLDDHQARAAVVGQETGRGLCLGEWFLFHQEGLREVRNGVYEVIKGKRDPLGQKIGRRPKPAVLRASETDKLPIVGRLPVLPVVVICPRCKTENEVAVGPAPG